MRFVEVFLVYLIGWVMEQRVEAQCYPSALNFQNTTFLEMDLGGYYHSKCHIILHDHQGNHDSDFVVINYQIHIPSYQTAIVVHPDGSETRIMAESSVVNRSWSEIFALPDSSNRSLCYNVNSERCQIRIKQSASWPPTISLRGNLRQFAAAYEYAPGLTESNMHFSSNPCSDNNHPALSILDPSKCTKCPVRTSCPKCKCPTVSCDTCRAEMSSECPGFVIGFKVGFLLLGIASVASSVILVVLTQWMMKLRLSSGLSEENAASTRNTAGVPTSDCPNRNSAEREEVTVSSASQNEGAQDQNTEEEPPPPDYETATNSGRFVSRVTTATYAP